VTQAINKGCSELDHCVPGINPGTGVHKGSRLTVRMMLPATSTSFADVRAVSAAVYRREVV
jgi:hypothetical protein